MLVAMICAFALTWAPQAILNVLLDYEMVPAFIKDQQYFVALVAHLVSMLSTSSEPLLYTVMNENFRRQVAAALRCRLEAATGPMARTESIV